MISAQTGFIYCQNLIIEGECARTLTHSAVVSDWNIVYAKKEKAKTNVSIHSLKHIAQITITIQTA